MCASERKRQLHHCTAASRLFKPRSELSAIKLPLWTISNALDFWRYGLIFCHYSMSYNSIVNSTNRMQCQIDATQIVTLGAVMRQKKHHRHARCEEAKHGLFFLRWRELIIHRQCIFRWLLCSSPFFLCFVPIVGLYHFRRGLLSFTNESVARLPYTTRSALTVGNCLFGPLFLNCKTCMSQLK